MRILIVEDEVHIADGLRFNLEADGFEVATALDGEIALDLLLNETVARIVRHNEIFTPILMLTALDKPEDVLHGFEAGTDDYLPKPFELKIFQARLNGLLRRREWFQKERAASYVENIFTINGKIIDFDNLELKTETETIHLTLMEAKLLRHLIDNEGKAVSRKTILEEVWGLHEDTDTRAIDNFIVRLRKLIENEPNKPEILQTVRGVGYRFINE